MTLLRASSLSLAVLFMLPACGTTDHGGCPDGAICDASHPKGPVHGVRPDSTPDVTVEEAWPARPSEPAPLTSDEIARSCLALTRCLGTDAHGQPMSDAERTQLLGLCLTTSVSFFWEERAVATSEKNERWTFEARAILASGGTCDAVRTVATKRAPAIVCEEAGCFWQSSTEPVPRVTCAGTKATLTSGTATYERDCSHAFLTCDTSSPTGCNDRAPVACSPAATKDRCEGDVRLGCDGTGKVSFHDCARVSATCQMSGDHVACVPKNAGHCTPGEVGCDGDTLELCVLGDVITAPRADAGVAACTLGKLATK